MLGKPLLSQTPPDMSSAPHIPPDPSVPLGKFSGYPVSWEKIQEAGKLFTDMAMTAVRAILQTSAGDSAKGRRQRGESGLMPAWKLSTLVVEMGHPGSRKQGRGSQSEGAHLGRV